VGVWGEERVRKKWMKKERIRKEKFIEDCTPIGSSMLSKCWVHIHVGDSNSCPPDWALGALNKWLASRNLVGVSAGFSLKLPPVPLWYREVSSALGSSK
jgi:hypothetical protein